MPETGTLSLDVGHPAPHRKVVGMPTMIFVLFAAPAAWAVELLSGFASTSYFCYRGDAHVPIGMPPRWLTASITSINLLALAVAAVALIVGLLLLRRTWRERDANSGDAVEAGEGRTRVLSLWGAAGSAIFAVAIGVNILSLILVPLCRT